MSDHLRIGLPSKGRLEQLASEIFQQAGLSFRRQERTLFARVRDLPVDIVFLRADDIPVLCAEGAIDLGVTGGDLICESEANVETRLTLGGGGCGLALCVPIDSPLKEIRELQGKRVATSFPHVTEQFLRKHDTTAHLVQLTGSVEIMIQLGVADAIVDLVETGSTLAANRLRLFETLGRYEATLIQGPAKRLPQLADRIVRRIEGVVIARAYSLLEYNIPRAKLSEAEKITPGFNSPTVSALEDSAWCAVKVMVKRSEVHAIMETLEALGASAILQTQIANCRL